MSKAPALHRRRNEPRGLAPDQHRRLPRLAFNAVVLALLLDIALNRARVISRILNALADLLHWNSVWLPY